MKLIQNIWVLDSRRVESELKTVDSAEVNIIKKILAGEKQLFSRFIDHYQSSIYNLAFRMLGNREDAFDITQETFLRTFKSLRQYDQSRAFSPWLHRIAVNLCINELRKRKVKLVSIHLNNDPDDSRERQIADVGPGPAEQVVLKESQTEIFQILSELPEKYKVPLLLRHFHQYTYQEIGILLEVPPGTVKTWIYRGRNLLKEKFKQKTDKKE